MYGDTVGVSSSGKYLAISADESILETEWNELVACTPPDAFTFGFGTWTGAVNVCLTDCWFCPLVCETVSAWWPLELDWAWPKIEKHLFLDLIFSWYQLFVC